MPILARLTGLIWLGLSILGLAAQVVGQAVGGDVLAVQGRTGTQFDIYLIDISRGTVANLTHHPAGDIQPAWSPDGQWLAFTSDRDSAINIHRTTANGRTVQQLTHETFHASGPAWSPDGQWLALVAKPAPATDPDLYLLDLATGILQRIVQRPSLDDLPTWSVDGRLAFQSWDFGPYIQRIYTILPDGSDLRRLTGVTDDVYAIHPAWSPDGEYLAFIQDSSELWVMQADGGGQRWLATACPTGYFSGTSWSPDGTRIALTELCGARSVLWLVRVTDGQRQSVTTGLLFVDRPAWRP